MMILWSNYKIIKKDTYSDKKKQYDNNIYTFDIETSNIFKYKNGVYNFKEITKIGYDYCVHENKKNDKKEPMRLSDFLNTQVEKMSFMYIWQFSVNNVVYYGRTWNEFIQFLKLLNTNVPERKIVYIHNLAFEFTYLKDIIHLTDVFARKPLHPIRCRNEDYNIEFRCSYMLTNCSLEKVSENYHLDISKKSGDLDYIKIRHSLTKLTKRELDYCKYDCLVIYNLLLKMKDEYKKMSKIPLTSTGRVRKRFKDTIKNDINYKTKVREAYNKNPEVYNMLLKALQGGYTHANSLYTEKIIKSVTSWDINSSYPYVMTTCKVPTTKFLDCNIKDPYHLNEKFAYLIDVTFYDVVSKYKNTIISAHKCSEIDGYISGNKKKHPLIDNGRVVKAGKVRMTLTDLDYNLIIKAYDIKKIEINKAKYANYDYLPIQFVNFVLELYLEKTKLKNIEGKENEYLLYKQLLNSMFGMCLTNTIREEVVFDDEWKKPKPLTNQEIIDKLEKESKHPFLSMSWGVWIVAHARKNLINLMLQYDKYDIYNDTDSLKLKCGYDMKYINEYNINVDKKIKEVCKNRGLNYNSFNPEDKDCKKHLLGALECDGNYEKFVTLGAKKYCVQKINKEGKRVTEMTVAGLPKKANKHLRTIKKFKTGLIFDEKTSHKNMLEYHEKKGLKKVVDYKGKSNEVDIISGACVYATTHTLGISADYDYFLSTQRAEYIDFLEE